MADQGLWIVVPVFETEKALNTLLGCLKAQSFDHYRLVVVDHGAKSIQLKDIPGWTEVIRGSPEMWWTAAVNRGIRYILSQDPVEAKTPILLQNADVTFGPEYLRLLLEDWGGREDVIVGSLCLDRDSSRIMRASMLFNRRQARLEYKHAGGDLSQVGLDQLLPSDVLTGRGTLIPRKVFSEVGLYNERLLPHYKADYELVYRAKKKGFKVFVSPRAIVYSRLDSQFVLKNDPKSKFNYLFDIKSVNNLKTYFFYAYLCFGFFYGTYFFLMNLKRILKRFRKVSDRGDLDPLN